MDVLINEQGEMVNLKVPTFAAKIGEKTNRDLLKMKGFVDQIRVFHKMTHFANVQTKKTSIYNKFRIHKIHMLI